MQLKRIDFNTVTIGAHTGYGNASRKLIEALKDRDVIVHPGSDVMLNFCMPPAYKKSKVTIGYTPWESTVVPKEWEYGLKEVDQLWATASWVANTFQQYREDSVWVLPHGVDWQWATVKHRREDRPFTFVHVGEPAVRKGGDIVLRAWEKAFKNRKDVQLIFKCIKYPTCRVKDSSGSIIASPSMYDNIFVIGNIYNEAQMWKLYRDADCMIYPTRGEGFGLIPFEAMASGLPVIIPSQGMGDFTHLAPLKLKNSKWVETTEQKIHPGLWMDHDIDEVIYQMEQAIAWYEYISDDAFQSAQTIHAQYSWSKIAEMAHARLDIVEL